MPQTFIPAALYIVPGRIRFKIIAEDELEEGCEGDEAPIEEHFFAAFLHRMQIPSRHDDCEIGYPDKFLSMQQQGWACEGIRRYGQWSSEAAATDDELYRLIGGEEGTNTTIYHRMSSPHLHLHWQDFQRQAALCLEGNEAWTCGFKHICTLAEEMSTQASVTISIYNPMNWPLSLFKWIVNDDRNYRGGSTVNRGHEHHRLIRCCSAREGRPRRFGGTQRDSGT